MDTEQLLPRHVPGLSTKPHAELLREKYQAKFTFAHTVVACGWLDQNY
jgi:hypothetical protein